MTVPEHELPQRRRVWDLLAELWLDSELTEAHLKANAKLLRETGYTWPEMEWICLHEVAPAVYKNLEQVAGVWGSLDSQWLEDVIRANHAKPDHGAFVCKNEARMFRLVQGALNRLRHHVLEEGDRPAPLDPR